MVDSMSSGFVARRRDEWAMPAAFTKDMIKLVKEMQKCRECKRQPDFLPWYRWFGTHPKSTLWHAPSVMPPPMSPRRWALPSSPFSPTPAWKGSLHVHLVLFGLPQSLASSKEAPRSPSLPRCCQSPRVTSLRSLRDLAPH